MVALAVASLDVSFDLTPYENVETFETLARVCLKEMVIIILLVENSCELTEEKRKGKLRFPRNRTERRRRLFIVVQKSLDSAQRSLFYGAGCK